MLSAAANASIVSYQSVVRFVCCLFSSQFNSIQGAAYYYYYSIIHIVGSAEATANLASLLVRLCKTADRASQKPQRVS